MAMQYEGKTYRNLQEQVGYLTRMYQDLGDRIDELRAQIPSKMIVEELPEEGDPLITYYVGPKGTEPNLYYEVWVWVQEEPDGPFVWRELEDTDQVDLSGYLPIQDGVTTYAQVYGKATDGTQTMFNMTTGVEGNTVARRTSSGLLRCANAQSSEDAVNLGYADGRYVGKQTGSTTNPQVYVKNADGTQGMIYASSGASSGTTGYLVLRASGGHVSVPDTPTQSYQATSKTYVDSNFLAKQTGASTYGQVYVKNSDGTQGMVNYRELALAGAIVRRDSAGQVYLPDQTQYTPSDDQAVSKRYVNAVVGQLLYLHDIEIIVTVDATNKLYIKAYLINGSSTAITAIDRATFKRMDVQYGAFGPNLANVNTCAVTKCPDSLRQDDFDEPYPAYLYQYISGGSLVSGQTTYAMTVTVTDSVITF